MTSCQLPGMKQPFKIGSTFQGKNMFMGEKILSFNPIALRKAKIAYNFGLSECNRVKS